MLQTFFSTTAAASALRHGLRAATRPTPAERRAVVAARGITPSVVQCCHGVRRRIYSVLHGGRRIWTGYDGSIPIITGHAEGIGSVRRALARGRSGENQLSLLLRYLDAPQTAHGRAAFAAAGGEIYDLAG